VASSSLVWGPASFKRGPEALPALPGRTRAPGEVSQGGRPPKDLPEYLARPPRCPGRPLRADSGLDGQVKPAGGRRAGHGGREGAGPGVAGCCRDPIGGADIRENLRMLFQRFTRRLDDGDACLVNLWRRILFSGGARDAPGWAPAWAGNALEPVARLAAAAEAGAANPVGRAGVSGLVSAVRGPRGQ